MTDIKITHDMGRLGLFLTQMTERGRIGLRRGIIKASQFVAGELRQSSRELVGQFTGKLARSFKPVYFGDDALAGGAFSDLIYAGIHDTGGTIHPKTVKFLTVPISDKARAQSRRGLWPRRISNLFCVKARSGNLLLAERSKKQGLIFHWLLKKSVTIGAKRYVSHAAKRSERTVSQIIDQTISEALRA